MSELDKLDKELQSIIKDSEPVNVPRYFVFYSREGNGWHDLNFTCGSRKELIERLEEAFTDEEYNYSFHVVDMKTQGIILESTDFEDEIKNAVKNILFKKLIG